MFPLSVIHSNNKYLKLLILERYNLDFFFKSIIHILNGIYIFFMKFISFKSTSVKYMTVFYFFFENTFQRIILVQRVFEQFSALTAKQLQNLRKKWLDKMWYTIIYFRFSSFHLFLLRDALVLKETIRKILRIDKKFIKILMHYMLE